MNVKRNAVGLAPYTSVNENLFLRGVAATYALGKRWEATGFLSSKRIDGNTASANGTDTLGTAIEEVIFSSFQEDGFHRTNRELEKKDAVSERIVGGHLRYKRPSFSMGVTAARVEFDADLRRATQPYNRFEFQGRENTTIGADWNVLYRNLTWFGEGATSANGGMAMNTGTIALAGQTREHEHALPQLRPRFPWALQCGLRRRHQPVERTRALHRFGDPSQPPVDDQCYFDQFTFPWLRFLTDAPSAAASIGWHSELAPEQAGGDLRSRAPSGPRAQHRCGCGWHRSAGAGGTDQLPRERELQGERCR
jgi:hypothetical protein